MFRVPFRDALDFIGVSAYWPLVNAPSPDKAALVRTWAPLASRLAELSARERRKVVFTELGYRSAPYAAWRQWEIARDPPVDLHAQTEAYEAFFDAIWKQGWFGGVYWWKWFSYPGHGGAESGEFDLEGKPAEEVVARHYAAGDA